MTEHEISILARAMNAGDVIIYSQSNCAYCEMAKRWLDEHGFGYVECDIRSDARCADAFKRYLATGTPYVVLRRGGKVTHLRNGFTSTAFLAALTES